jgi:hypothetical protein
VTSSRAVFSTVAGGRHLTSDLAVIAARFHKNRGLSVVEEVPGTSTGTGRALSSPENGTARPPSSLRICFVSSKAGSQEAR